MYKAWSIPLCKNDIYSLLFEMTENKILYAELGNDQNRECWGRVLEVLMNNLFVFQRFPWFCWASYSCVDRGSVGCSGRSWGRIFAGKIHHIRVSEMVLITVLSEVYLIVSMSCFLVYWFERRREEERGIFLFFNWLFLVVRYDALNSKYLL